MYVVVVVVSTVAVVVVAARLAHAAAHAHLAANREITHANARCKRSGRAMRDDWGEV